MKCQNDTESLSIEASLAQPAELEQVAALYAQAGYGQGINAADTTLVARVAGRVIGVVRLCPEHGTTVLRGMQIAPSFQRKGIGAQLLAACIPHLNHSEVFCLPYAHLASFYAGASFEEIPENQLPPFLALRLENYRTKGKDIIGMRRWARPRSMAGNVPVVR